MRHQVAREMGDPVSIAVLPPAPSPLGPCYVFFPLTNPTPNSFWRQFGKQLPKSPLDSNVKHFPSLSPSPQALCKGCDLQTRGLKAREFWENGSHSKSASFLLPLSLIILFLPLSRKKKKEEKRFSLKPRLSSGLALLSFIWRCPPQSDVEHSKNLFKFTTNQSLPCKKQISWSELNAI